MDPNSIYVKTAAGENAIQQRTRVIQRNVRMVLILVDGQSSVADLSRKTGNPQLTENALLELEKGGFVELKVEQHDSLWEESKRVAHEIRSAAIEKAVQFPSPGSREKYPDFKQSPTSAGQFRTIESTPSDAPISMHSMFDEESKFDLSIAPQSAIPLESRLPEFFGQELDAGKASKAEVDKEIKNARATASKASFFAQLRSMWASAERELDEEPIKRPIVRGGAKSAMNLRTLSLFGVVVLFLGALAVFLFPFEIYRVDIESAFAKAVGQPSEVGAVRLQVSPVPELVLSDVRVGGENDQFRVREIRLQPDVRSLFSAQKRFRAVVITGAEFQLERFAGLRSLFTALADPANSVKVGKISLDDSTVSVAGLSLKKMEAEFSLTPEGALKALLFHSADKAMALLAQPTEDSVELTVEAYAWRPVEDSRVLLDSANLKGRLRANTLSLADIELRLFDGLVKGNAIIRTDTKPNVSGAITFERINASRFAEALGVGRKLVGDMGGKANIAASADTWSAILATLGAEGDFVVQRGSVVGIDLAEAVRRVSGTPVQGGMTAFEQMSGRIRVSPGRVQLSNLVIDSGLMQSTGRVEISGDLRLSGRMELQMRGSANQTRVSVAIDGPLDSPSVRTGVR